MSCLSTLLHRLKLSATDAAIVVCVGVAALNALVAFWEWLRVPG